MKNKQKNLICSSFLLSWVFFHQELKCGSWLFAHLIASITVNWRHILKFTDTHSAYWISISGSSFGAMRKMYARGKTHVTMCSRTKLIITSKWWRILIAQYSCSNYAIGIHAIHSKYVNWIDASQYLHKTNHYYSLDFDWHVRFSGWCCRIFQLKLK